MAENITLVALSQMVDLSLNCQEGLINFQALHTLLHVMIQELKLNDVAIEFRGPDSDRIQMLIGTMKTVHVAQPLPKYTIKESKEEKDAKNGKKKKGGKTKEVSLDDVLKERQRLEEKKEKELRVIERRKDSKEDPDPNPLPLKSPPGSLLGLTPADLQTVVVVEQQSQLPQFSVAISKTVFDDMQTQMQVMKDQIKELTELPGNMGLIESTRSTSAPILDMFNILNLTKRMDATELAMEKLGSLIEDLAKESLGGQSSNLMDKVQEVKDVVVVHSDARRRSSSSFNLLEKKIAELEKAIEEIRTGGGDFHYQDHHHVDDRDQDIDKPEKGNVRHDRHRDHDAENQSVAKSSLTASEASSIKHGKGAFKDSSESLRLMVPQKPFISTIDNVDLNQMSVNDALSLIKEEFENLKQWITISIKDVDKKALMPPQDTDMSAKIIESKFHEYQKKIEELNNLYNNQIGQLNEQLTTVQHEMTDVITKLEVVLPGGDSAGINAESTLDLANKLSLLEQEIIAISDKAEKLEEDKESNDRQTQAILEQIDVLKIVKANREDLEEALGDKADACMINRKVSHDQFDAACDDLSRGIEEALHKLEEQEEMWRQALDSIHREVGSKLDKMEVDPLRDFVNSRIKALQEKFKSLTALKKEQEAAGTKSKILKNVNCISCDKDVVMRKEMDPSLKPKAYAMPPNRNMAPYLAYELDQLRKQQKCVPGSKNLNFIENALRITRGTKEKDHLCNRYCGGSHTVTTPQQRVTRLGHFLEQWGPEIAPLQDEYIRGNDNQMYKARGDNVYKKINKQGSQTKGNPKSVRDNQPLVQEKKEVQTHDVYISPEAKEAIMKEENNEDSHKKALNIGSTGLATGVKILQDSPSPQER